MREARSLGPDQSRDVEALGMSSKERDAYVAVLEVWNKRAGNRAEHQLLGHPHLLQGEMQLECQLASNGIDCGSSEVNEYPRLAELEPEARDWRLLAQFDCDEHTGMEWGDAGMLYFWIKTADLAARRFDRAWTILQCL